jgi:hypothetical protein
MPTWSEIQEHMRAKYKLEDDTGWEMSMVWTYDDGRSQKIRIRRYTAFDDREMIELKSAFARKVDLDPVAMLRKNSELPLATVALDDELYIVVYNVLLRHLDLGDFDLLVSRVAAVADTLEEKYVRRDEF